MKKSTFIIIVAALILLAAAVPAMAHYGNGAISKNHAHWNDRCLISENGTCVYAENCPIGDDCPNDCHLNCMNNAKEKHSQTTPAGHHLRGAHHSRNK